MKITNQILSIPPYISTTWANVASLSLVNGDEAGPLLLVELVHGGKVVVPGLEYDLIQNIFTAHEHAMESNTKQPPQASPMGVNFPTKLFGDGLEKMGLMFQHNPEESDIPPLPSEILDKISNLIKGLGLSESAAIPEPHEGCNCSFCQIARAFQNALHPNSKEKQDSEVEEPVSEEDLKFCDWDINSKGDQLYDVTNRLDRSEQYQVYLGKPIGCTCGRADCEHIRAVLRS
jgi:hypothetical protein